MSKWLAPGSYIIRVHYIISLFVCFFVRRTKEQTPWLAPIPRQVGVSRSRILGGLLDVCRAAPVSGSRARPRDWRHWGVGPGRGWGRMHLGPPRGAGARGRGPDCQRKGLAVSVVKGCLRGNGTARGGGGPTHAGARLPIQCLFFKFTRNQSLSVVFRPEAETVCKHDFVYGCYEWEIERL